MKKLYSFFMLLFILPVSLLAQEEKTIPENATKGFSFGALPAVAYDSDLGFRYGALANFYWYGDGSCYPDYMHSWYIEYSRTTKGSSQAIFTYDSKYLIPKTRITSDLRYVTEQALDFYGFNGYQSNYLYDSVAPLSNGNLNPNRLYYRYARNQVRFTTDFQYQVFGKKVLALAGFGYFNTKITEVNTTKLNDGKPVEDQLADTSILRDYVAWNLIPEADKAGGSNFFLKLGAVYDSRNNEANPSKGIWTEAFVLTAPAFLGNDKPFSQFIITHRQYFTIKKDVANFVYRVIYSQKLSGDMPFYMMPFYYSSKSVNDAFGGSKTLRGVLRDRVIGDAVALANFEVRYKVLRTMIGSQNFYIALSAFSDMGQVVKETPLDLSAVPASEKYRFEGTEGLHIGYGGGVHFALNENFIVAVDYGLAAKKQDGNSGLYIGLNWLF
jgi:outer membrane protein assembly factor BamA